MANKRIMKFGIIGCGLMGREFAVATSRWPALLLTNVRPEIVGICDVNEALFDWYTDNFKSIKIKTKVYQDLLSREDIDAIYCAVPHILHEDIYIDIIRSGKHLMGEKPFGIDLGANERIMKVINEHPEVFVRCSSEFPFYPGAFAMQKFIQKNPWGQIISVNAGFMHSSDLNKDKAINWKRMVEVNGEYGCMGDLGMHGLHIPIRFGWIPNNISASLSNIVKERPDGKGGKTACKTWDNASITCDVNHPKDNYSFPMNIKTYRIAPGETNTWYIEILGTEFSARFSTKNPKTLETMHYKSGGVQEWRREDLGYSSVYPTITGGIFEFGFTDSILQMWASFVEEASNQDKEFPYGCIRPEETLIQHEILTAALKSGKEKKIVSLK